MSKHIIVGPNGPFQGGGTEVVISHLDDSIRLGDGSNLVTATPVGSDIGLDVNVIGGVVSGDFTSSGLSKSLKPQMVLVTDVPTKVPSTPLVDRNSMTIRVWNPSDPTIIVYFGGSTVTTASGYPKLNSEEMIVDIKDNASVELYAICETGKTAELRVFEVA